MPFDERQLRALKAKLSERHIRTREEQGITLSYIEGWHAIAEANRIFGFDAWDREVISADCIWQDGRGAVKTCGYTVRIRIRVRVDGTIIFRDGSGAGYGRGPNLAEAHEKALKEAETDATKRALITFGNSFGLALYGKEKLRVRPISSRRGRPNKQFPSSWVLQGAEGETLSSHAKPEAFCADFKETIYSITTENTLHKTWARNLATLDHLRTSTPDLVTAKGDHYVEVLTRCYEHRSAKLKATRAETIAGPESNGTAVDSEVLREAIDKSELAIGVPKRIRDEAHRRFVAVQPCLICGRIPAQAHHLRFAQPRSMGSKVSDEWTVPLCVLHHRSLHDVGDEAGWWTEKGIDAKSEAERLWQESRRKMIDSAAIAN